MSRHRRRPTSAPPGPAEPLAPVEIDDVKVVTFGTALWLVAFLVMIPFYDRLGDDGRAWWLWCALAGFGLGVVGIGYCRRRQDRGA